MAEVIDLWKAQEQFELLCECDNSLFKLIKIGKDERIYLFCSKCNLKILNYNLVKS